MDSEGNSRTPYSSIYAFLKPNQVLKDSVRLPPPPPAEEASEKPPPPEDVAPKKLRKVALCCAHGVPCPVGIKASMKQKRKEEPKDEDEGAYVNMGPMKKASRRNKKDTSEVSSASEQEGSEVTSKRKRRKNVVGKVKKTRSSRREHEMKKKAKKSRKEPETVSESTTGENTVTEEEASKKTKRKKKRSRRKVVVVVEEPKEVKGENSDSSKKEVSVEPPQPTMVSVDPKDVAPPAPAKDSKDEEEAAYVNLCPVKKAQEAAKAKVPKEVKEETNKTEDRGESSVEPKPETSEVSSDVSSSRSRRKTKGKKRSRKGEKGPVVMSELEAALKKVAKTGEVKEIVKENNTGEGAAPAVEMEAKDIKSDASEPIKKEIKDDVKEEKKEVIEPKKLAPMILEAPPPGGPLPATEEARGKAQKAYLGSVTSTQAESALQTNVGLYHRKFDFESEAEAGMFLIWKDKGGKIRHWRVIRRPASNGFRYSVESGRGVPEGRHRSLNRLVFYYEKRAQN